MARRRENENAYMEVMFGYDSDYAYAVNVIKNLYLGPGKPGPGDEWNMPRSPLDETAVEDDDDAEDDPPENGGFLGRLVGLLRRRHS